MFSTQGHDRTFFEKEKVDGICVQYFDISLTEETLQLARGHKAVCIFVNDVVNAKVLSELKGMVRT